MNEWKRENPQNRTQQIHNGGERKCGEKEKEKKQMASHKIEKRDGLHGSTSSSFISII